MRTSVDVSTASKCVTGIYTSNYNVTFYDLDYNNESAFQLIHQHIDGLSPTSSSMMFSMTTTNIGISSLPTTFCPNCDNCKLLYILFIYILHITIAVGNVQGGLSITVISMFIICN